MADADNNDQYDGAVRDAADRVSGGQLPTTLQTITDRHHAKLVSLVETMRAVGVSEDLVRHSVRDIVASYERELVGATLRLAKERT